MTRTVVIGGGVAGLATAALLGREGHDVTVLERNDRVGGRAGVLERDGFRFDTGPSWYLMPRVYEHFYNLLGTSAHEQLDLRMLDPGYQVFSEPNGSGAASVLTMEHGAQRACEAFEGLEPGAGAALREHLASAARIAGLAEQRFLYNPFTNPLSLVGGEVLGSLPTLATLLRAPLDRHVAKRFNHPLLRQVLGYPAVFLGTDPGRAPALYHLMSSMDLDDGVRYPMGGFWGFITGLRGLAEEAGAKVVTGADVTSIQTAPGRRRRVVTGVHWRSRDGRTHRSDADLIVSAADLHHTETSLLNPGEQTYPESWWRKRESGPGAVIALLGVEGRVPELGHHSLFFTKDWDANFHAIFGDSPRIPDPASLYVCKPSATEPDVAPPGHENLFVLIPVPAEPGLGAGGPDGTGDGPIERATDAAVDQMARWANVPDLAERVVVRHTLGPGDFVRDYHSWRGGMLGPSHILRQSAMFRAQNQSKRVDGLYYAGATTAPGVGVPMCLISAELVLKRIRGDRSAGPTTPATGVSAP